MLKWVASYSQSHDNLFGIARFGLSRTNGIAVDISRDGITVDISSVLGTLGCSGNSDGKPKNTDICLTKHLSLEVLSSLEGCGSLKITYSHAMMGYKSYSQRIR